MPVLTCLDSIDGEKNAVVPFLKVPPVEPPSRTYFEEIVATNTTISCLDSLHGEPLADSAIYGEVSQVNNILPPKVDAVPTITLLQKDSENFMSPQNNNKQMVIFKDKNPALEYGENMISFNMDNNNKENIVIATSTEHGKFMGSKENIVIATSTALAFFTLVVYNITNAYTYDILHIHDDSTNLFPFENGMDYKFYNINSSNDIIFSNIFHKYILPWPPPPDHK